MNGWLLRPRVMGAIAVATFVCIALFQLPSSPAASAHFMAFTGAAPFDERPAGYTLSGVLAAFRQLGAQGLFDYAGYRAVDAVFPWLLCGLVAAVMLRLDAARATMWPLPADGARAGGAGRPGRECVAVPDPAHARRPVARARAVGQPRHAGQVRAVRVDARDAAGRRRPRAVAPAARAALIPSSKECPCLPPSPATSSSSAPRAASGSSSCASTAPTAPR